METTFFHKSHLNSILSAHSGNRRFATVIKEALKADEFLRILTRYAYFNSAFSCGVAILAGQIAARQDLFRDASEPEILLADRSVEVAAHFLFAAIDDYCDRDNKISHRALAQATLKSAARYFGFESSAALSQLQPLNASTRKVFDDVRAGYGVNQTMTERKLFQCMGFHMGSEILADSEFSILHAAIREKHPALLDYLEHASVEIDGKYCPAHYWIAIHTTVEAEHFDAALVGVNHALRYYAGKERRETIIEWVLEGFRGFASAQAKFMAGLKETPLEMA